MGQVSINVNGRDYQIACDDGEEQHIEYLAGYINHHAQDLVGRAGQVGEARLLLMTALVLADELSVAYSELDEARGNGDSGGDGGAGANGGGGGGLARADQRDDGVAWDALETLLERLEQLAARLEKA